MSLGYLFPDEVVPNLNMFGSAMIHWVFSKGDSALIISLNGNLLGIFIAKFV